GSWATFWPFWHNTKGWGTGGYHEIILRDGTVELCYDPEEITNGVGGQNSYIYNICLVGNGSFTEAQERTFEERASYWMGRFGLTAKDVKGHNEFPGQATNCPGIDMNAVRSRLLMGNAVASTQTPVMEGSALALSSPALKEEIELTLGSKARRQMIVDQAIAAGYSKTWQEKLDNKTITNDD